MLTMVLAAGTILYLMFTTSDTPAYREGLFGGVFFRAEDIGGGGIGSSLGVASGVPLAVVFAVLAVLLAMVQLSYRVLSRYRDDLLAQRAA